MLRERRYLVSLVGLVAVASLVSAACSDDQRDDISNAAEDVGDVAESVAEDVGDAAETAVSEVQEAAGDVFDDAAELAVRNIAAEQGERAFEEAGQPIDDSGLDCEATVGDGADSVDVSCTGTTADGGMAELTGTTSELPGASITNIEGDFTGTVDGAEVWATDTLGD